MHIVINGAVLLALLLLPLLIAGISRPAGLVLLVLLVLLVIIGSICLTHNPDRPRPEGGRRGR